MYETHDCHGQRHIRRLERVEMYVCATPHPRHPLPSPAAVRAAPARRVVIDRTPPGLPPPDLVDYARGDHRAGLRGARGAPGGTPPPAHVAPPSPPGSRHV